MSSTENPSQEPIVPQAEGGDEARDEMGEQCLLYLYGEFSPHQAETFERQLSESGVLADELARQAVLISLLSGCSIETRLEYRRSAMATRHTSFEKSSVSLRRLAAFVVAIAASILAIVFVPRTKDRALPPSEDLKIAQVWATNESSWLNEVVSREDVDFVSVEEFIVSDSTEATGPFGDEMVPSWLLAALDSSSELLNSSLDEGRDAKRESGSENL